MLFFFFKHFQAWGRLGNSQATFKQEASKSIRIKRYLRLFQMFPVCDPRLSLDLTSVMPCDVKIIK